MEFRALKKKLSESDQAVEDATRLANDTAIFDRYRAVNVHDVPVTDDQRRHFTRDSGANFWPIYLLIKGRRDLLEKVLSELSG